MNQSALNMTQLKALTEFFRHLSNISYTYLSNSTDMNVNSSSALNSTIVDLTARNLTISALNSKSIQTTVSREWQYLAGMILGIFLGISIISVSLVLLSLHVFRRKRCEVTKHSAMFVNHWHLGKRKKIPRPNTF